MSWFRTGLAMAAAEMQQPTRVRPSPARYPRRRPADTLPLFDRSPRASVPANSDDAERWPEVDKL
jgi:hypothetical protein